MLIRIVKMTFRPDATETFQALFDRQKASIRAFDGCKRLELLQNKERTEVFMTYSWWDSEEHLAAYRESDLFKATWAETKVLFAEKPEAWSMEQKTVLD